MVDENFNLVTDPWIKVINKKNKEEKVSLLDLFKKSQTYCQLAGEMKAQDLAILRFLLAILTTIYSRYDANGKPYTWLNIDKKSMIPIGAFDFKNKNQMQEDLINTWSNLYKNGHFGSIVSQYLLNYKNRFNLFGTRAFYQVDRKTYDSLATRTVKDGVNTGKGIVAIKQINRSISESNNRPDIFSPKSDAYKNQISNDELIRWLITYQNYTGTTDKTKVKFKKKYKNEFEIKYSSSSGWLYGLNTVFVQGNDLFQTLIFNLKLLNDEKSNQYNQYPNQKPVWEWDSIEDYLYERLMGKIKVQKKGEKKVANLISKAPNNIAQLYTLWSRIINIHWENGMPILSSIGLPIIDATNNFVEPMTTWKENDKDYRPHTKKLKNISESMWRHFGDYVEVNSNKDTHEPGIVNWLDLLKGKGKISPDTQLTLRTINFIKDDQPSSQMPVAEIDDEMRIDADILFSNKISKIVWPERIENEIILTHKVIAQYKSFVKDVAALRNLSKIKKKDFSDRQADQFYQALNRPFLNWLASLRPSDNEKMDFKIEQWHQILKKIAFEEARSFMHNVQPQEILGSIPIKRGKKKTKANVFQCFLIYEREVNKTIKKG